MNVFQFVIYNLPTIYNELFSKDIAHAAFSLAVETFKKTRFASHVYFLSRCLRLKIVPNGFQLNFNATCKQKVFHDHVTKCSFNLIRSTLQDYLSTIDLCTREMPGLVNGLRFLCTNYEHFNDIRGKIHFLNQSVYEFFKDSKQNKFTKLLKEQRPTKVHNQATASRSTVFTIPEGLPLSNEERSVLNKQLKVIPRQSTIDEFQEKHDAETFFRRLRLKAHFHEKQPTEEQDGGEITPSPDASIIDSLYPKKSTSTPQPGKNSALDLHIDKCRYEISKIDFKRKSRKSNRSKRNGTH